MPLSAFDERNALNAFFNFVNGSGTTLQTILGASGNTIRIDHIIASNSDTIAHVIDVYIGTGGDMHQIGSASIPAGTGHGGVPALDVLPLLTSPALPGIVLQQTQALQAAMEVAVVGAFIVVTVFMGGYV
jgi:hypothetical protein